MKRHSLLISALLCATLVSCSDDAGNSNQTCGNGVVDGQEQCDASEFADDIQITCPENMMPAQTLVCSDTCMVDLNQSCVQIQTKCGNGNLDDGEPCDGKLIRENTEIACPGGAEPAQTLVCTNACAIDLERSCVSKCGNGRIDDGEACDQTVFRENIDPGCPDKYIAAQTLACTDSCTIDVAHSCIAPMCNDGVIYADDEECDQNAFSDSFSCDKGKHKAEKLVCDETCHVDKAQSCINDQISPIFTQFVVIQESIYYDEYVNNSMYDMSMYEITNVGDGTDGSKCGVYHVDYTFDGDKPVYKATSKVWAFPESMESGKTVVLCADGYNRYTEQNASYLFSEYYKTHCDFILETLKPIATFTNNDSSQTSGKALAIVCGDINEPAENSPVVVSPIEIVTPGSEAFSVGNSTFEHRDFSNAMRRCDQTEPVCSASKSIQTWLPITNIGRIYYTSSGDILDVDDYEARLFWEDMGKFECNVFKPIVTQVDAEITADNRNIFAIEFMNVGTTKDHGHCALYYANGHPELGYIPLVPIEKIVDYPDIEPLGIWTVCSESTKQILESLPSTVTPPIKLPCDMYLPDSQFDHARFDNGKHGLATYCDEDVKLYPESEIANGVKSDERYIQFASFTIDTDDHIIRNIRRCDNLENAIYETDNLTFRTGTYVPAQFIHLLASEPDSLLKKFSDDFGSFSCPMDVIAAYRCGNGVMETNIDEACDVAPDTKIEYASYLKEQYDLICKAKDSSLVAYSTVNGQYGKPEQWYCTDKCKLDTDKSCTKCGNGVIDLGELCEKTDSGVIYSSMNDIKTFCSSQNMVLLKGYEQTIENGKMLCLSTCQPNSTICSKCGNGKLDESEDCDGTLYNSSTCDKICHRVNASYSCIHTNFKCKDNCTIDTAATCNRIN